MAKPQHGAVDWDAVYTAHGQEFLSNVPTDNFFSGNPSTTAEAADVAIGTRIRSIPPASAC